jgi:Tol biopolymer transport system component
VIFSPDRSQQEGKRIFPYFLPDERHYLYTAQYSDTSNNGIYVGSLDPKEPPIYITKAKSLAIYVEPGYLLFQRAGSLYVQPFDANKLKPTGSALPINIKEKVIIDEEGEWGTFSASKNRLIYRSVKDQFLSQFVWVDRNGKEMGKAGEPKTYLPDFDLLLNENQITVRHINPTTINHDIYLLDLNTDISQSLTNDSFIDSHPHWSPDGNQVLFNSWRENSELFVKDVDSAKVETPLLELTDTDEFWPVWSEGYILYSQRSGSDTDIYAFPTSGEKEPIPIVTDKGSNMSSDLSLNEKWLAYQSNRSSRYEIYVRSFPKGEKEKLVSINGGMHPQWSEDRKELYYLSLDGKLMAVKVSAETKIESETPVELFDKNLRVAWDYQPYLPNSDGSRFLLLKQLTETGTIPITVVLNWTKLLNQ